MPSALPEYRVPQVQHPTPRPLTAVPPLPDSPAPAPVSAPATDAALLARCRRGDSAAWDEVLSRYERLVFSVARRSGLSREDAADATQDAFMALLESIGTIREDERVAAWLCTVVRRLAWRLNRQNRRTTLMPDVGHYGPEPISDPTVDWVRVAVVADALNQLEEPCRGLIHGLYFDPAEPSYAELAERLGRSVGGIGPLRGRCLSKLRSLIGEEFA